jgi:hypothetical protein
MWLVALGLVSVVVSMVFDSVVRLRLRDAGMRGVFWQGGTLNYGIYLRLRREKHWSAWPVYLIALFLLFGIGCIIFGLSIIP